MTRRIAWHVTVLVVATTLGWAPDGLSHQTSNPSVGERLPTIGAAPAFALTTHDGTRLALPDLRGKVVAVTFIYASCVETCSVLTTKMAGLQRRLGHELGRRVVFVSITVDPERDTPELLRRYARAHRADLPGWVFLTGAQGEIREIARRYGVVYAKTPRGDVDHTFLTSLVDQSGNLRVQYLGVRWDPDEMLRDLRSLLGERRWQ